MAKQLISAALQKLVVLNLSCFGAFVKINGLGMQFTSQKKKPLQLIIILFLGVSCLPLKYDFGTDTGRLDEPIAENKLFSNVAP